MFRSAWAGLLASNISPSLAQLFFVVKFNVGRARAINNPRSDNLCNIKRVWIHMGHLFRIHDCHVRVGMAGLQTSNT